MSRQRNVRVRRSSTSNTVFADKLFNFNTLLIFIKQFALLFILSFHKNAVKQILKNI